MEQYEITFIYQGRTLVNTRKVMGYSAKEAEDWLRDTFWSVAHGHDTIEIIKTKKVK